MDGSSVLWNSFEPYSDAEVHVTWLQLVPVTAEVSIERQSVRLT